MDWCQCFRLHHSQYHHLRHHHQPLLLHLHRKFFKHRWFSYFHHQLIGRFTGHGLHHPPSFHRYPLHHDQCHHHQSFLHHRFINQSLFLRSHRERQALHRERRTHAQRLVRPICEDDGFTNFFHHDHWFRYGECSWVHLYRRFKYWHMVSRRRPSSFLN